MDRWMRLGGNEWTSTTWEGGKETSGRVQQVSRVPTTADAFFFCFSFVTRNDVSERAGMTTGCGACDVG